MTETHRPTTSRRATSRRAAARPVGVDLTITQSRAGFLVDTLGVTHTASLLGVSKSQPSRWRSGAERPSPAKARELVDLDHVVARASLLWAPDVVHDWLEGPNPHLDGARPVDVVRVRGSAEVLSALDAEASGAFG